MEKLPPFFTWIEADYAEPRDVPVRLRSMMQILWLHGMKIEEVARHFRVPESWADEFVHDSYPSEKPN
jgi:hypothetical protein